ncbi:MAG: endonuclease [Isosphaeraceae bacterium]
MAAPSKAQLLDTVYNLLRKRYKLEPKPERLSVMESIIYGICHEGTTREQANQAVGRFKDGFFDWNEVRVSPMTQVRETLADLPDPDVKSQRLRRFLRQMFSKTYGFNLDALVKGPQKDAVKALRVYEATASDYVLATAIQHGLGGHAIPIDRPLRRALERLGLIEANIDDATARAALERAIPKNRGAEFVDLMEELSHDTCVEGEPECPRCELKKVCPTGQVRLAKPAAKDKATAEPGKAAAAPAPARKAAPEKKTAPAPAPAPAPARAAKPTGPRK